jgi:hypothetical protein
VDQGRLDTCGALFIAGHPVGVPTTAVAAAIIQMAQACRAIATSTYCDLIDTCLKDTRRTSSKDFVLERPGVHPKWLCISSFLAARFLPRMLEQCWGRIIVIGSSGIEQPIINFALSNSIRSAVLVGPKRCWLK